MNRKTILALGILGALATVSAFRLGRGPTTEPEEASLSSLSPRAVEAAPPLAAADGFQYGRITTTSGDSYEGRLRWGGSEETLWSDLFHGHRAENPWVDQAPPGRFEEVRPLRILGLEVARRKQTTDLSRPFVARFGDLTRIEVRGKEIRVTSKSGRVVVLDRYSADDIADGVRVYDADERAVDLSERKIRLVELLSTPELSNAPAPLYGTVETDQGDFTGFVQWNRRQRVGTDELVGRTGAREVRLPFHRIRTIARRTPDATQLTLDDDSQIVLDGPGVGAGHRGVGVEDPRYGRVQVPWPQLRRVVFHPPPGSGPSYDDFPPAEVLDGRVTTRDGRSFRGRLVFDLDESEATDRLDAPYGGLQLSVPFSLVSSITPGPPGDSVEVRLWSGIELPFAAESDLGPGNAGILVFQDGPREVEYVEWSEVGRIELRPPQPVPPSLADPRP